MITLRELGPAGLRERIEAQDQAEMVGNIPRGSTDIATPIPSPLGVGGAVTRKTDAAQRMLIDSERHAPLIRAHVDRLYNTPEGRQAVRKHVDTTRNTLQQTANALAVVYERPPVRTFPKGSKRLTRAFTDVYLIEAGYNQLAEQWARYAWLLNVVHVLIMVHDGRLVYEEVLPHAADVVFDAGEREPSILAYLSAGAGWSRVAVDNERFWYLDENWEIVRTFEHRYHDLDGRPMQPWVQWRTRSRMATQDYWLRGQGRQLVDTTLKIGVVNAAKEAVRQNGNSKLRVLSARSIERDIPGGQILSPERELYLRSDAKLEVHDLIVPVAAFLEQMDDNEESLAESYGVRRGTLNKTKSSADGWAEYTDVARQRQRQVPHLRRADLETVIRSAIIMRAEGHPRSAALDPARIKKIAKIEYQAHTYHERPKDRFEAYELERAQGLASHVDQRMREHPDEDRDTASENLDRAIDERNKYSNQLAKHNLSADAGQDGDNLAQLQGRIGGMDPDGNKPDERRDQPKQ